MCFVLNHEWYAEVYEVGTRQAGKPTRCQECGRRMPAGSTLHTIYMQQHEWCGLCQQGDCDCSKDADGDCIECKCEEPDTGESFDYDRCTDCHRFLEAVKQAELAAGCSPGESQPYLEMMVEDIGNGGPDEARKYWTQARAMFPALEESGYLAWLWSKIFPSDDEVPDEED